MQPRRRRDGSIRWQQVDVHLPEHGRYQCRNCPAVSVAPWKFYCSAACRKAYLDKVPEFWEETRRRIIKRDGRRCTRCGSTPGPAFEGGIRRQLARRLEVDHIKPVALFPDLEFDDSNLRTLCHACHVEHGAKPSAGLGKAVNAPGQQRLALHDHTQGATVASSHA